MSFGLIGTMIETAAGEAAGLIRDSVVGDSGASRHSFNNLKWFEKT